LIFATDGQTKAHKGR